MFIVEYALHLGTTRHYAPSAQAALSLVRDIAVSGGMLRGITRTRDGAVFGTDDLERLVAAEISPNLLRPPRLAALRRLFGGGAK